MNLARRTIRAMPASLAIAMALVSAIEARRGRWRSDVAAGWFGNTLVFATSHRGAFELHLAQTDVIMPLHRSFLLDTTTPAHLELDRVKSDEQLAHNWKIGHFRYAEGTIDDWRGSRKLKLMGVPVWIGTLPFTAMLASRFRRAYRRGVRAQRGLCLACGYDLRGSASARCSECGTRITGDAETRRSRWMETISRGLRSAGLSAFGRAGEDQRAKARG